MAPVFALMEQIVLDKMRQHVGWKDGEGDGIFAPGDTIVRVPIVHFLQLSSFGSHDTDFTSTWFTEF